jgi:hypothetical protein
MVKKLIVGIFISAVLMNCGNHPIEYNDIKPSILSEAETVEDTLYVVDWQYYDEDGDLVPACSMAPAEYYCGCMKKRLVKLDIDTNILNK